MDFLSGDAVSAFEPIREKSSEKEATTEEEMEPFGQEKDFPEIQSIEVWVFMFASEKKEQSLSISHF